MPKQRHIIVGIHITDRLEEAVEVQKLLTTYGKGIETRLGLHEIDGGEDRLNGLILLEMAGPAAKPDELVADLNALAGVEAKSMLFEHPAP